MLFKALTFIDRFVLELCRRTKSGLGRARILVFTQTVGPTRGASIADFLVKSDPTRGTLRRGRSGQTWRLFHDLCSRRPADRRGSIGARSRTAIPVGAAA